MDLFDQRNVDPMLIGAQMKPFDDPRFLYELKFDGERCVAYVDKGMTDLRNKRHRPMLPQFPELSSIHGYVAGRCILDGELTVLTNGKPDFEAVQARSIMTQRVKIALRSVQRPATYIAYDIIYQDGKSLLDIPLIERKRILTGVTGREGDRFSVSRTYDTGVDLFKLAGKMGLEGAVAKRRDSLYRLGKETKDWIKFKHYIDEDFVVAGFILKPTATSLVLGLYDNGELLYQGHLTSGVPLSRVRTFSTTHRCPFQIPPKDNEGAIWFDPLRVCIARYMHRLAAGGMRQAVFIGFRDDKRPIDCVVGQTDLDQF